MQYSIFISGSPVDLPPETKPEFSKQANNIGQLADVKADEVIGLDLPDTGENRRLTKYVGLADNANGFARDYFRVDVNYDGVLLIDNGLGYILEVENGNIRLNVISGNANIFNSFVDLTLQDLRFPELDHLYDLFQVTFNINNSYTDGFIYPLIDYGRTTAPTIYDKVVRMFPDNDQNIFPAMFERYVFEAIFAAQGYSVAGDFFDDAFFSKCIIPYVNEEFKNGARYAEENQIDFTGGALSNFYGITGDFFNVIDDSQFFIVAGSATVIATTATIFFELTGDITSNEVILSGSGVTYNVGLSMVLNGVLVTDTFVTVVPADIIELAVFITLTALQAIPVNSSNIFFTLTNGGYNSVEFSNAILYGDEVQMEAQLPAMTQTDYVKSVMHRFGLIVQTDNLSKICTFYSLDEVSQKKYGVYNFTQYLTNIEPFGYSRKETRFESYGKINVFSYSKDETVTPAILINGNFFPYGTAKFNLTDNTLQKFAEILDVAFSGTNDIAPAGVLNEWLAKIPHWIETDVIGVYEPQEIEPRCLYLNYKQVINVSIDAGIYGTNVEANAAIANFDIPNVPKTLHFSKLISNYYPRFVSEILGDTLKLEVWCFLPAILISEFDHRKPVYFAQFGAYFYVNQIQSFVGNETPTKLFLTRV